MLVCVCVYRDVVSGGVMVCVMDPWYWTWHVLHT